MNFNEKRATGKQKHNNVCSFEILFERERRGSTGAGCGWMEGNLLGSEIYMRSNTIQLRSGQMKISH